MAACAEMVRSDTGWHKETLEAYEQLRQYYGPYMSAAIGKEFVRAVQPLLNGAPLRILDVGAGRGETSLYLADHGHQVFPVEPSYEFCEVIEHLSRRFSKNMTIYNSTAEHLATPGDVFDVVIFNVSLHHCDDPSAALKNVSRYLRPGGKLLLISEPMLPFFKTHASVQQDQVTRGHELGDYGGNEHSYRYSEYVGMLEQAGFRNITSEVVARYRSKEVIRQAMQVDRRPPGFRKKLKSFYLNLIYQVQRPLLKPLLAIMKHLSLVQLTFSATK